MTEKQPPDEAAEETTDESSLPPVPNVIGQEAESEPVWEYQPPPVESGEEGEGLLDKVSGEETARGDQGESQPVALDNEASPWDVLYGVLFQPHRTYEQLAQRDEAPVGLALVVFVAVTLLGAWVSLSGAPTFTDVDYMQVLRRLPALIFVMTVSVGILSWFGWSATLHLVAEFLGGRGGGLMLFSLVGLSYLPRVFIAPVAVLANATGLEITSPFQLVVALWALYLHVVAVRVTHRLSGARAVVTVLLPGLAIVTFVIIAVVMLMVAFMPLIDQLGDLPL